MKPLVNLLRTHEACVEAVAWAEPYGDDYYRAYQDCDRGDWLLWIASLLVDRKLVVKAACQCARLALKFVPENEQRPLKAIEAAEGWIIGEKTLEEVKETGRGALAIGRIASRCAYYAGRTTYDEWFTYYASDAAYYTAISYAVDADPTCVREIYHKVRSQNLAKCAEIVKEIIAFDILLHGLRQNA